ncbi:nose resistant to fluoxetine protein 6-like [Zophobas morio]|uniref:nose resistant to fluoxetine protein 6-like n=1 Tax=Zophobas morio TaxID=2755281 RepID=UPI0030831AD4
MTLLIISKMNWRKFAVITFLILTSISSAINITDEEYRLIPDLFNFDDYDKCIFYSTDPEPTYCRVTIKLLPKNRSQSNAVWSVIEQVSSDKRNYCHDLLRHGICASKKCVKYNTTTSECLNRIYSTKYGHLGLDGKINQLDCETKEPDYVINTGDLILLVVLGTYVVFVVIASIWLAIYGKKTVKNEDTKISPVENFLSVFSLSDNFRFIFNKNTGNQTKNYLSIFQGIRFFCSLLVIGFHALLSYARFPVSNPQTVEKQVTSFSVVALVNHSMLFQAFFFISSFLTTVNFYNHLRRVNDVTLEYVVRKIVKRYIKFTSAQIILIALQSRWFVHLSRGPFWDQIMGLEGRLCSEMWWTNLLYINNFFFDHGLCLLHSWSLSVEFQLTVIGLLVLWLTQKNSKRLFLISIGLLLVQVVWTFFYLGWNNFEFSTLFTPESLYGFTFLFRKEWQATWITTVSNLAGLAWGLLFGYIYSHRQNNTFITKKSDHIWWYAIVLISTFGTIFFSGFYKTSDYYSNSRWFAASYGSIEKVVCVFGISLFIFGTLQGLGGFVRNFLEWAPMHTLGTLSFGTYLVHFTFFNMDIALKRNPTYFSPYLITSEIFKNVVMSNFCSVILTAFVLMPIESLTNRFL